MAKNDTEEKPKKKRSKLKLLLIIILILGLLGGAAAGAWFFFLEDMFYGDSGSSAPAETAQPLEQGASGAQPMGTTVALPAFTVNLADPLGQRFIKISLEIEVADAKAAQELNSQGARVRDSIIMLLSSKSYADIATPESKIMLKSEIVGRLTGILGRGKVRQVFITDMVIQ